MYWLYKLQNVVNSVYCEGCQSAVSACCMCQIWPFIFILVAEILILLTSTASILHTMGRQKTKAVVTEPQGTVSADWNGGSQSKIQVLEDKVETLVQTVSVLTESMKKTSQSL